MVTARLFNPQNDLALAAGRAAYTPPGAAAAFARAGALLPAWWSGEADIIAGRGLEDDAAWLRRTHGLTIATGNCAAAEVAEAWGWSANAASLLAREGVAPDLLPCPATLDTLPRLSHRRTAITIRRALGVDEGFEAVTTEAALEYIRQTPEGVFAKSPWSCSGRGVMPVSNADAAATRPFLEGIIRRQGSVMLERNSGTGLDFAALFERSAKGQVEFAGWSVFASSAAGAYAGNLVAPQQELEAMIDERTELDELKSTVTKLERILGEVLAESGYAGPLGVDMLAADSGFLNPCIELNLRRTMGFVARDLNRLHGLEGRLTMNGPADALSLTPARGPFNISVMRR